MRQAHQQPATILDVDLVAAQFDALDSDTHREALLEGIRARDAYRKLVELLRAEVEKLKLGLIGPKSERSRSMTTRSCRSRS